MDIKNKIIIVAIIVLFSSLIAVSANDYQFQMHDLTSILQDNDVDDMTGCCSVVLQEDGNNSMFAFRRDAENAADIFIENVSWHGKDAIKQYKTSSGYFCQVIVTNDGWVIGYGGIDDGPDNEKIENITGNMIQNKSTITNDTLAEIQAMKAAYGLGHAVIKAPNGDYGIVTATSYSTGKLSPGEYISLPNKIGFMRSGTIDANTSDKVDAMVRLAITDGFGLTRRDVTTFDFNVGNESNVTDIFVSNDDGSAYGMSTGGLADNVIFNGTTINAADIPIAPSYKKIGNITFKGPEPVVTEGEISFMTMALFAIAAIIIAVVAFFSYHFIRVLRYRRRYRR